MGKRELLLAVGFVLLGAVVYQFTAAPADPSRPGFSISRLMDHIRREVRGQREMAEGRTTKAVAVPPDVQEIRLNSGSITVTITGEDRPDIEADFQVRSTGYDPEEARRLVQVSLDGLKSDQAGPVLIFTLNFPREGRQTGTLALKVPKRLGVRMDGKGGPLKIANVASVAIGTARGETTLTGIAGTVSINQRGNELTITDVGVLKLQTGGGAEVRISNVRGDTTLNLQGGELRAERLAGGLEVESRDAEMRFEQLDKLRGPVRVNAVDGEVEFMGLKTETRIDARQSAVRVEQAAAAPLSIYGNYDGSDAMEVTLADAGMKIDAVAGDGRITLDEKLTAAGLTVRAAGDDANTEHRLEGMLREGGPPVVLRATRGNIVLRSK